MKKGDTRFLFTIDADWIPGSQRGLERLFEYCARERLPVTVFVTGRFAVDYPDVLRAGIPLGADFGTHGWAHGLDPTEEFRRASLAEQRSLIERSTDVLQQAVGVRARFFRAPNLWVSEDTLEALTQLHYTVDSSVPSGRFDLGLGQVSNPRFLFSPSEPYHPDPRDLRRRGESVILEIPPSACIIPINMSALRKFGVNPLRFAVRVLRGRTNVVTFYCHPTEFESADRQQIASTTPARYRAGLGPRQIDTLARFIDAVREDGLIPVSMSTIADEHPGPRGAT